ncbi:toprim domain-containing protein [Catalinimonas sp. 4WD22]|uniref:toprim domain-containing protein n=1 Tax=Catalinimonas locisalis TaxID=3133978 RepID=UPI003100E500
MEYSSFRDELNYYKENIDIRDYLETSGYTLDKTRDTARYRAYSNQENGDKIYIPRNSKYGVPNYYVNQFDNDDKGTVIDFVMSREQKSLNEARLTLRDFQQGYVPTVRQQQTVPVHEEKNTDERRQYMVEKIAKEYPSGLDDEYLEKRLLSSATLHHSAFKGKIKLNEVSDDKWVVFPLENEQGKPTGLSMKGNGKERILGEKSGVWISHPSMPGKEVDQLVITEHPIDAMSYHQLHGDSQQNHNTVYLATAGNPSHKQLEVIQSKVNELQPKEIVLANDNDKAGHQYDEKYREKLQSGNTPTRIEKSQFKDWNADLYATALYRTRLLDRTMNNPRQVQLESKTKASPELEIVLEHKKYRELTKDQKQYLPSYFIERTIEGKKVEFSLKEVAFINNDKKLEMQLGNHAGSKQFDKAFVAEKTQDVEDNAVLNKKQEKSLQSKDTPETIKKRINQVYEKNDKRQQAIQEADNYVKNQAPNTQKLEAEPQENRGVDKVDGFMATQKRYNHQIDALQQKIAGNPAHEEMSRKLHYYKNYPHLNDQEIDTYISIEDKMSSQQPGHTKSLARQQDKEIGI